MLLEPSLLQRGFLGYYFPEVSGQNEIDGGLALLVHPSTDRPRKADAAARTDRPHTDDAAATVGKRAGTYHTRPTQQHASTRL
ncbi:hypothetical protein CKAN_00711800 [Cinnamomum micranthum f. kanehirae]|uniref:Uncharacterized protein n=1 Tax=Cinnamomum micranthum f. kanehirae TaxID=337451 RepID=A0A3S3N0M7_9MAGN|nr:hypothetical protein CKAN_00711800 [Cinnamomum micranthum f. kanehirae]